MLCVKIPNRGNYTPSVPYKKSRIGKICTLSIPLSKNPESGKMDTPSVPLSELAESATPDTLSPPSGFP